MGELTTLSSLCSKGKSSLRQKDLNDAGSYPVYGASGIVGYLEAYQNDHEYIAVVKDGAGVGRTIKCKGKSSVLGTMQALLPRKGVECDYLLHLVRALNLGSCFSGSTIPHIYFKDYGKLPVPSFSPEQQRGISGRFEKVESLIDLENRTLECLNHLIKSQFVEMFENDPSIGRTRLKDVCSLITDGTHQPPKFQTEGIPFLFVSNIASNELTYETTKYISQEDYETLIARTPIEVGDILVSAVGSFGHPAIVKDEQPFCFQRHIAYLKPMHTKIDSAFLHAALLSDESQRYMDKVAKGAAQRTVTLKSFKELIIPLPPLPLQQKFAAFVAEVDKSRFVARKSTELIIKKHVNIRRSTRCEIAMNFDFLKRQDGYYDLFADACIEAEKIYAASPAMCAVGCRKALELAVKWVYAIDQSICMPYRDNLSSLLHESSFRDCVDERVWRKLIGINKLGNLSVHTDRRVTAEDAILSLRSLFEFVDWIDYCYGPDYENRSFDETKVPRASIQLTVQQIAAIKARESLFAEKEEEIKRLEAKLKAMSKLVSDAKEDNTQKRTFNPEETTEFATRKRYIDWDLGLAGWKLDENVLQEREVHGMPSADYQFNGTGFIDYLLLGKDGKPLAVLEAKKTTYSAQKGMQQARLYAQCLESEYGYKPPIFLSNGFETWFIDDEQGAPRQVSAVFSQDDLQKILNRRDSAKAPSSLKVDESIAGGRNRYYQVEAIKRVCANIEAGHRKSLLVMATGTGKTRVSAALVDVLMRSGHVKNVLFLADRVALVRQAKNAYQNYLPNVSLCNLLSNKDERGARIVFSTYPTILNAIDNERNEDGDRMYTVAHFDLIIVDEAHRSIFKKYRAIFNYFDALVVGLTATPANEVDRNTYDFFEVERGVPTYVYEYKTATEVDHVLVPYYGIETHTNFIDEGITYDDLTPEDKETIEEDFEETGQDVPDRISANEINSWVFNESTVDNVIETLMEQGIKVNGGQTLGKTVIFAQSQKHARFIVERFGKLYPNLPGDYIKAILYSDDYSHTVIDDFELKELPVIAVSVDMMDTGVDVPEIVNLVFFKKVRSKIKFWQMIGRGTRLCEGLEVEDPLDGSHEDKQRFFIFDWCRNFEFFQENPKIVEGKMAISLSETIFQRQAELIKLLQESAFASDVYQSFRNELIGLMHGQVIALNDELFSVRQYRREVDKYRQIESYRVISATDFSELKSPISMLIVNDESDTDALRFDALMYGYMVAVCSSQNTRSYKKRLEYVATSLKEVVSIPQVKDKLPLIEEIADELISNNVDLLTLEEIRKELRDLIRFITHGKKRRDVITHLEDPVTKIVYGVGTDMDEDYEDYKLKVERYLRDYSDTLVINKLRTNKPMTSEEFTQLEYIFTHKLGNAEDYAKAYGNTPFGLLVRKLVHLDREAAMEAFADFLNDQSLNEQQISFVKRVVNYVVDNGYMEPQALMQPPFDRPKSFVRMFTTQQQRNLLTAINTIRDNATQPAA